MTKSVVILTTSHDKMGDTGNATGSWAEEIMSPYWEFKNAGYKVTIASMKGGRVPLDAKSLSDDFRTEEVVKFYADNEAVQQLENSVPFSSVSVSDYDAVFVPGGHGVCWDMAEDAHLQKFLAAMYESGKVVGSVCHGPVALANVKLSDGSYLCAGKAVTGFSNTEEDGVGLTSVVPFLLEDKLKEVGGKYTKGQDWKPYAQVDGRLITGQNPQSSKEVGRLMIEALS